MEHKLKMSVWILFFKYVYTNMNLLSLYVVSLPPTVLPPAPYPSWNKGYIDHVTKKTVFPHGLASDVFFLAGQMPAFVIHSAYFNKLETLETRIAAMFLVWV